MADNGIASFAKKAMALLQGEKEKPKREPRSAEVITPAIGRGLEAEKTKPSYVEKSSGGKEWIEDYSPPRAEGPYKASDFPEGTRHVQPQTEPMRASSSVGTSERVYPRLAEEKPKVNPPTYSPKGMQIVPVKASNDAGGLESFVQKRAEQIAGKFPGVSAAAHGAGDRFEKTQKRVDDWAQAHPTAGSNALTDEIEGHGYTSGPLKAVTDPAINWYTHRPSVEAYGLEKDAELAEALKEAERVNPTVPRDGGEIDKPENEVTKALSKKK